MIAEVLALTFGVLVGLLTFLVIVETITLVVLSFFVLRLSKTIFAVEDAVEEGLDVLDKSYFSIHEITSTPVFFDNPEVRRVVVEIKAARDAILFVASKLSNPFSSEDDVG